MELRHLEHYSFCNPLTHANLSRTEALKTDAALQQFSAMRDIQKTHNCQLNVPIRIYLWHLAQSYVIFTVDLALLAYVNNLKERWRCVQIQTSYSSL
jgi:hypothetical protein